MHFSSPLLSGTLIQRYKRFLADVRLDTGETVTATCPNTGSMIGLKDPGLRVWLSTSDSPTRKYKHTWEMVEHDLGQGPALVGVNTSHPNAIVTEAIQAGKIKQLKGYAELKREQKYGKNSRIDILLTDPKKGVCYVEIKNVHLSRKAGLAEFPDSVTERGAKHLVELSDMVRDGHRAMMVYLIQRNDTDAFALVPEIDPAYVAAFKLAEKAGVEMLAVRCHMSLSGITIDKTLKIKP
ncbi:MAG: DNA/RNA nuclease SfsA [Hyphomicrobiaceae bacterium]|nr:DNA/RNA nuclease SfsA [Hyphomicrobiaceae bacterium]